jgi:general secretion pathway protein D
MRIKVKRNGFILVSLYLFIMLMFFAGCMRNHVKLAEDLQKNQRYEEALEYYFKALKGHPDRIDLKVSIDHLLKEASRYYFLQGRGYERSGKRNRAVFFYKKSLEFDPGNNEARNALKLLVRTESTTKTIDVIKKEMALNVGLPKILRGKDRLDLVFKSRTSLKAIFKVLSKTGNVNILLDPNFKDDKVTLELLDVTFYQALERICQLFKCKYYILDERNIVIALDSKDSDKRYKKLLIKNIFFSNVDAADAKKIIESVFRPEKLTLNKMGNSLMVTDSLENVALVEKLAQFIDKRQGEVEISVEIMEVDKKKLREYGTELSSWQIGAAIEGTEAGIGLNEIDGITSADIKMSVPQVVWKFFSSITDSKILSRPKIRGLDKEEINIKLGEKRPIPMTTFVPIAVGGVNQQPITSYTLTDVGISLTITPTIHHNREVTLELTFELTYVTDIGGAYTPPTLGNRKISTKLRLRDGETGIIAGLMRGSSTRSRSGIPILNRIPIIKDIFSSNSKMDERTDILLSITPRVLRMPEITRQDVDAYLIGTGQKVELRRWQGYKGAPWGKKPPKPKGKKTGNRKK